MTRDPECPTATRRQMLARLAGTLALTTLPAVTREAAARQGLALLEVVDRDSGQVLPLHPHEGRHYVAGRPAARYALRVRNVSDARVLVVLSVDGVNVITGETADWKQTGYVLDPGRVYDINGWRKSDTEVAAFEFAPIAHSYAARTGRPDHVGVIGMAVFRERMPPPPPPPPVSLSAPALPQGDDAGKVRASRPTAAAAAPSPAPAGPSATAAAPTREAAAPAPGAEKSESSRNRAELADGSRLGTGHGQREWSVTRRTRFDRAGSAPDEVVEIGYDSLERLIAAGIVPRPPVWGARPRPFPSSTASYVPDPPRW